MIISYKQRENTNLTRSINIAGFLQYQIESMLRIVCGFVEYHIESMTFTNEKYCSTNVKKSNFITHK